MRFCGYLLLLLLPTLLHADLSTHRCGEPSADLTRHGKLGEPVNDFLGITCDAINTEKLYLSCGRDNQWTLLTTGPCPVPTCKFTDLPPQSENAVRTGPAKNQLNDTVTFRCRSGRDGVPISFRCQKKIMNNKSHFHWKPQNKTGEGKRLKTLNCTEPIPICNLTKLPQQSDNAVRTEPAKNQLNDTVTFECRSGLDGGSISFRCEKKVLKGKMRFHWKPQNRTAEGGRLKILNCTGT